jgi:regulator of RNase E activity RraA
MGLTKQVLPKEIQSIHTGQTLAGRALTLLGGVTVSTDPDVIFRPFLKMLGEVRPGDLLVSQPNDDGAAHLGELSCETAQHRGARGAVIDGGVRDVDYIIKLGFPVFARYKTPRDINGRWRLVDYNVPIMIENVRIDPGDYVVGDRDGVVIIPKESLRRSSRKERQLFKLKASSGRRFSRECTRWKRSTNMEHSEALR